MIQDSTICAVSTAPGQGGVALIRVAGPKAFLIVDQLVKININSVPHKGLQFTTINRQGELVDETVIARYNAPHSFTGDDIVEIMCHGSTYIQQTILSLLVEKGCRLAEPGEFTKRAFLNGKMDLTQAEAVADLIASESSAEHNMALNQMRGGFSKDLQELRQGLVDFASLIELELDFAEEDVEFADRTQLHELLDKVIAYLHQLIGSFKTGNVIKSGIPVAIVGRPNAGKSTLMNRLLNEERAIVSDIPGTTRDTIEEVFILNGVKFRLIDTAGIRESEDAIEKIGIERSFQSAQKADIVIYLYDPSEMDDKELQEDLTQLKLEDKKVLVVANKSDINSSATGNVLSISALSGKGIDELINVLHSDLDFFINQGSTVVSNVRHLNALQLSLSDLEKVKSGLNNGITGDFIAMDIRSALHHLGSITGDVSTDELLGNIFSRFCIGK